MKFSSKVEKCGQSPMRKFHPYAVAAKARGIKVYHLNIGQPDVQTPPAFFEAIRKFEQPVLEYAPSPGIPEMIDAIKGYYDKLDMHFDKSEIYITTGGSEALAITLQCILDDGDEILIPEPFYPNYNTMVRTCGASITPIPTCPEEGYHYAEREKIEPLINEHTRAIMVTNPGNPTGVVLTDDEMKMLVDLAKKHDLFLIGDEVYREFCYDGAKHFSAMNLTGLEQNVIMIDSVSKRYSMCGVRLGTLASRNEEVLDAVLRMGQARLCPPYLAQVAALAALDTPKSYFEEVHDEYMARRDCIVKALNEIEGVYCPTPRGAFYSIVRLPVDDSERFARWLLEEFRYNDRTVMLAPAAGFYGTPGLGRNEVRIAYVLKREDLLAAAECMKEALKVYPGRMIR